MDEPGARMTPTIAFLESVEQRFSARYPSQYKALCFASDRPNPSMAALLAGGVEFICDLKRLQAVNVKVGEEQWGDYEQAIAGRLHAKDGDKLWGGILPFATQDDDVFGFDAEQSQSEKVLVWSVHTIVGEYPTLASFCEMVGVAINVGP